MKRLKKQRTCAACDAAITSAKDLAYVSGQPVCRPCLNGIKHQPIYSGPIYSDPGLEPPPP